MIHDERIRCLNDRPRGRGSFVVYWMQQAQRARFNHALEYAIRAANELNQPTIVLFGLTDAYPEANARHYRFMLEGLQEVERTLGDRLIKFVVRRGDPDDVALAVAGDASLLVCDRGYLRHQVEWRCRVAREAPCSVVEIETDAIVPVDVASGKQEHAARTLRPKIQDRVEEFLGGLSESDPEKDSRRLRIAGDVDLASLDRLTASLNLDSSVRPVRRFTGGTDEARRRLTRFLRRDLDGYDKNRNEPGAWQTSMMSPYLHFGQISPLEVARKVRRSSSGTGDDRGSYIEELLVRRELALNFVRFEPRYDAYACLPRWARQTLDEHRNDPREHVYTLSELEAAETHDPYWNAAMREMVHTGFMQNYMRMYWGKKILEWTKTPEHAFRTVLELNNKYFLDGRDPSSYANVAWCFGLHDRGWTERAIFGKVRFMNARGLERKFDMDRYVEGVDALVDAERLDDGC